MVHMRLRTSPPWLPVSATEKICSRLMTDTSHPCGPIVHALVWLSGTHHMPLLWDVQWRWLHPPWPSALHCASLSSDQIDEYHGACPHTHHMYHHGIYRTTTGALTPTYSGHYAETDSHCMDTCVPRWWWSSSDRQVPGTSYTLLIPEFTPAFTTSVTTL